MSGDWQEGWPESRPWWPPRGSGKTQAIAWVLATDTAIVGMFPDPGDLGALACAVDVPQNRRPGSYFWTSRGERVVRIAASPPRPARPRRLRGLM